MAKQQEPPLKQDFCDKDDHGGAVHRCIHAVIHLIEDHAALAGLPVRFAATKAIEGDALILQQLQLDRNEQEMLEHIVRQMETERGLDRSAAIADMRFDFIERLCAQTVIRPQESKERIRSEKIDRILTGRYTAIPCFIGIMVLVFYLTFNVIGGGLQKLLELGIDRLSALTDTALTQLHVNPVIHSLVIDGIFTGVGSVLSFLPIIVTLFFLPVFNGRQRLYCPRGLCNGQAAAQDRPVRQEHRAHAHRLWLHRAGGHGHPHLNQRAGSKDDHSAHALYELHRQTAHLLLLRQRLFPGQGRADHVRAVPAGDPGRHWSRLSL